MFNHSAWVNALININISIKTIIKMNQIQYYFYETSTGRLMQVGQCIPADINIQTPPFDNWTKGVGSADLFADYYSLTDSTIKQYPTRPSQYHQFDFISEAWFLTSDGLQTAKDDKKSEVNQDRSKLAQEPVTYQDSLWDADSQAISNLSSVLLMGLDETITWRDHGNINHDFNISDLQGLANEIKNRNSYLYARSWAIKADIDALESLDAVLGYVIEFGLAG